MAAPSQMQVRYLPEEDRIYWRLNTTVGEEFRFWLTRRFLTRLMPVLRNALLASPTVAQQASKSAQQTVLSFEHEKAASKATFNVEFKPAQTYPLGETPLLLSQAKFKQLAHGALLLSFQCPNNQSIDLNLSSELLHLLSKLLEMALERAEWDLPILIAPKQPTFAMEAPSKNRLN